MLMSGPTTCPLPPFPIHSSMEDNLPLTSSYLVTYDPRIFQTWIFYWNPLGLASPCAISKDPDYFPAEISLSLRRSDPRKRLGLLRQNMSTGHN